MKAKLFELQTLYTSGAVKIERDEINNYTLINQSISIEKYDFYSQCIKVNATYEKGYNIKNISAME